MRVPKQVSTKVAVDAVSGCWRWSASTARGYARTRIDGDLVYLHRWTYELLVGPIPEGMQLDHLCHTQDRECLGGETCTHRACINPGHLEPVSAAENLRRAPRQISAVNSVKTTCPQGHPYSGTNAAGHRICRACGNAATRRYYARKAATR